ncbi:hypothetical protein QC823_15980, partial [Halomonas vilamensis]
LDTTPDTLPIPAGLEVEVLGNTSGKTINLENGASVVGLDAGTADVNLAGIASTDVTVVRNGTTLEIRNADGDVLVSVAAGTDATTELSFSDGSATMAVSGSDLTFGGQTLADGDEVAGADVTVTGEGSGDTGGGDTGGADEGQTFSLTQGADNPTGAAGDDTFNAFVDAGTATFQPNLDTVDGGEGNDTLVAYGLAVGAADVSLANVTNVENLVFRATGASQFDMSTTDSGSAMLKSEGSSAALDFNNIGSTDAKLNVTGATGGNHQFTYTTAALAGAADAVSLDVNGAQLGATQIDIDDNGGTGAIETLNVDSSTAASSFTQAFDLANNSTLNVTGDANLTLTGAMNALNTVAAGDFTGDLSIDLTGAGRILDVVTGSGDDTVSVTHGALVAAAGATQDSIDLGAGDADRVVVDTEASATTAATINTVVSNAEVLRFTPVAGTNQDDALVADAYTNINTFEFGAYTANDDTVGLAVTGLESTDNLVFRGNITGGINAGTSAEEAVTLAGASANQTANLSVGGTNAITITGGAGNSNNNAAAAALTADTAVTKVALDVSSAPLTVRGGAGDGTGADGVAFSNVSVMDVTGSQTLIIEGPTAGDAGFDRAVQFNAGDYTGDITVTTATSATGDVVTTGSGNDTITTLAGNDTVTAGDGNDNIVTGAGNDTIDAGAGNDQITAGAGIDSITTGTGEDVVSFAGITVATSRDTVTDFDVAMDELRIGTADTTAGTLAGAAASRFNVTAADDTITATTQDLIVFQFNATNNGADLDQAGMLNGTELLKGVGDANPAVITVANGQTGFMVATDGEAAYLYHYNAGVDTDVAAGEIALVGTFDNVTDASALAGQIEIA